MMTIGSGVTLQVNDSDEVSEPYRPSFRGTTGVINEYYRAA
jgi:hypothetical protein